ncbi:hypothetical protein PG994_012754 [Apiospora phragmitis]|uniref:Uncharacterized protein n=1 Tax=Apiospora phragmitis TaxID=2905665 RepID=A0ABR1TBF3_9PEZI
MDWESLSAEKVFAKCVKAFRDSLSEQDRLYFRDFSSADEMLAELKLDLANLKIHKADDYTRRVVIFTDAMAPYFDVVNAFVQVKPDVMGCLWGSLLLILRVSIIWHNYSGFFDKVTQMLEDISTSLPHYRQHLESCRSSEHVKKDGLVKALCLVYTDILEFVRQILVTLMTLRQVYLVLDGVDECKDQQMMQYCA